jgi:hypothetical protein
VLTELVAQNAPPDQREEMIDELTEMIVGYVTKL